MPNIASSDCLDTSSTDANCLYPAKALGGSPHTSPNVYFEGEAVEYYDSTSRPDNVDGIKINPLIPAPCQPGIRTIVCNVNTTVFINGRLPAVTGDLAQFPGTNRPLTGPFNYLTIDIA